MSLTVLAWLALIAYTLHIMEEFFLDWRDWARAVIGLQVDWPGFYITNAAVVVLGVAQAELAATLPLIALTFAALMLINATFFHVLPMIVFRGRFSPGVVTAVLLFYPLGFAVYGHAFEDGVLTAVNLFGSIGLGAMLMAYPIVLLRIRDKPYFRQDR